MNDTSETSEFTLPRDVIANTITPWVEDDGGLYEYVDKIVNDLWRAGYRVVRSRYPIPDADTPGAALLLVLDFPGTDTTTTDPDELADDIASAVNEGLAHDSGRIMVGGIPSPQWLTPETFARLRDRAQ